MKIKFYIVEEYWYSETFRYIFADKDAAFVAQLLLEPDTAVQEIELEEPSEIKRFKEGVRFACKELKDVYDRTE